MVRLSALICCALLLSTAPATSQQNIAIGEPSLYLGSTYLLLRETEEPGALAELFFYNADVNKPADVGSYSVTLPTEDGDITVNVLFEHNVGPGGPDRIRIVPPQGMMASPEVLTLMEGYSDVAYIYPAGVS